MVLEFKKLYNQHAVLFKNDPLKLYYWNSIYFNYRGEYSKSLDASRQHLREAQKSRINDELSKSYRILAKSHMYLNSKDSSLYYSNLSLNFARRSNSENAILDIFKVQAEVFNHFGMIGQSTSVLIKFIDKAEANRDQKIYVGGPFKSLKNLFKLDTIMKEKPITEKH